MTFNSLDLPGNLYFITATVSGWNQLFLRPKYAKIILNSLSWLRLQKQLKLFAFVLMPSHLHAVIKPENIPINEVLQKFGSFTAHAILKQLKEDKDLDLLNFFHEKRRDNTRVHSIWQDIQAKNVITNAFLWEKMEYIHQNPARKEWHLCEDRADYGYSSACFYDRNEMPIIEIDDVRALF